MAKTKKGSKLTGFAEIAAPVSQEPPAKKKRVRRGQGETVAITVRLSKDAWMQLRQFAMVEGETLQTLAIEGLNLRLKAGGRPPIHE